MPLARPSAVTQYLLDEQSHCGEYPTTIDARTMDVCSSTSNDCYCENARSNHLACHCYQHVRRGYRRHADVIVTLSCHVLVVTVIVRVFIIVIVTNV